MKSLAIIGLLSLFILNACGSGTSGGGVNSGGQISQPGNLITDTKSIIISGSAIIKIINNGQSEVTINSGNIVDQETKDTIDATATDCYNKTLNASQTCKMVVKVYPGEAGVTTLELNTNNGIYSFPININTSGEGILATNINTIATTKEQTVDIINKGALPITLTAFHFESSNTTLQAKDDDCLNKQISSGEYCQIKVKAVPGQYRHHTLFVSTSNQYLKTQQLQLYETTNRNRLNLFVGESSSSKIPLTRPGAEDYTVENTGTNDIHVSSINLLGANIGNITDNNCNGKMLQAGDKCNITLNVNKNAYGAGKIVADTAESLESGFNYTLNVYTNNLTVSGSNDVVMHTNTTKNIVISNNNAFDILVDSIDYDKASIQFNTSCNGYVHAGDSCKAAIKSLGTPRDNSYLQINEFNGKLIKQINVDITEGIAASYQNLGNAYYAKLPQNDGNFYQVFTVTNHSPDAQNLILYVRDSQDVAIMRTNYDLPSTSFLDSNCITNKDYTASVPANSRCEVVLREPSDLAKLQQLINDGNNPDKGNFRIQVNYAETGDTYLHKYQGQVITQHMHRDPTYQPGAKIIADQYISVNSCGIQNSASTLVHNYSADRGGKYSDGVVINADLIGGNTISLTGFSANDGLGCFNKVNNPWVLQGAYPNTIEIMRFSQFNDGNPTALAVDVLSGSNCMNNNCDITLAYIFFDPNGKPSEIYRRHLVFPMPLPASDWTVATSVIWQDLGTQNFTRQHRRNNRG